MADKIAATNGDGRRDKAFSVRLSKPVVQILNRVGTTYGMGMSQSVRYIILDWDRMKQEQENN